MTLQKGGLRQIISGNRERVAGLAADNGRLLWQQKFRSSVMVLLLLNSNSCLYRFAGEGGLLLTPERLPFLNVMFERTALGLGPRSPAIPSQMGPNSLPAAWEALGKELGGTWEGLGRQWRSTASSHHNFVIETGALS